jgi:hypothetical protein
MKKIFFLGMFCGFLLLLSLHLFAQQEAEFEWEASAGWGGIVIYDYVGTSKTVTIPETINGMPVTVIATSAFAAKQLTSVTIPDSVTVIGDGAFSENKLTSIIIPPNVKVLGSFVFEGNSMTSITIGENVSFDRFTMGRVEYGLMGYDDFSFNNAYLSGGRKAGTYTRPNAESTTWTRR